MKVTSLLTGTLLGVCWLALSLVRPLGAEAEFRLFTEVSEIPERGKVTNYVLLMHGRRFSFLPPPRWCVRPDAAGKRVHLLPQDLRAGISFEVVFQEDADIPPLNEQALRQRVLDRYPEAKITNEFRCYTSGAEGTAFDIERLVEHQTPVSSRIAFVRFAGGTVEFELTTDTARFADYHLAFGRLLSSFRIEPAPAK